MTERTLPEPIQGFRDALGFAMKLHHDEVEAHLSPWSIWSDQDPPDVSSSERSNSNLSNSIRPASNWLPADARSGSAVSVVLLAASGRCVDVGLFRTRSVEIAANWAVDICRLFTQRGQSVSNVLLVSVCPSATPTIHELDLELFRSLRWRLSVLGVDLLDWIETDGDHVRSFAHLTCPATAWPD